MKSENDLMRCLADRVKEELHDIDTYNTLYDDLMEAGMEDAAEIIEDIARDEYSHARAIAAVIGDRHPDGQDEANLQSLWAKARVAFGLNE